MNKQTRANIFYTISLLCGLWFLLFGTTWSWLFALFIAYPLGLVGIFFWYFGLKSNSNSKLKNITLGLLIIGFIVSVVAFILTIFDIWVPTIIEMPD
jgi:hypothetical protein